MKVLSSTLVIYIEKKNVKIAYNVGKILSLMWLPLKLIPQNTQSQTKFGVFTCIINARKNR